MTQMALGKSCLWQRQLPRADLWCLNHYAMLPCCNHFAICYVPWCFRTLEIVVWFNVFGVVCGLLETWSIMFPEGGRSEVEEGIVFHYCLSKMNVWKISSDSIYYGKWKTNYILLKGPPGFFCETIGTTYVAKPALYTILILKGSKSTIPWERQTHVNENIGYMWHVWGRKPDSSMTLNTLVTTKNCLNKRRGNRKVQLLS